MGAGVQAIGHAGHAACRSHPGRLGEWPWMRRQRTQWHRHIPTFPACPAVLQPAPHTQRPHLHAQRLHVVGAVRALHKVGQVELDLQVAGEVARGATRSMGNLSRCCQGAGPGCLQCTGASPSTCPHCTGAGPSTCPHSTGHAVLCPPRRTWFQPSSKRMGMVQMKGLTRVVDCGTGCVLQYGSVGVLCLVGCARAGALVYQAFEHNEPGPSVPPRGTRLLAW